METPQAEIRASLDQSGCSRVNSGLLHPDLQRYNAESALASELEAATHLIFYYCVLGVCCGWSQIILVRLLNPNGSLFRLLFSTLKALNAAADPQTWNKIKYSKPIN